MVKTDRQAARRSTEETYRRIEASVLEGAPGSPTPTAVLVLGPSGAGTGFVAARQHAELKASTGACFRLSSEALRHAAYAQYGEGATAAAADWLQRLTTRAGTIGANLVLDAPLHNPQAALAWTSTLGAAGYVVKAAMLATNLDTSRQLLLRHFDMTKDVVGVRGPRWVAEHDQGFEAARATLERLEATRAVGRIVLLRLDGSALYDNSNDGARWRTEARALNVIDEFRRHLPTGRDLAERALRWQTLVQKLVTDSSVPREVASTVLAWRNELAARAERDPDAKQRVGWGFEAEAFRSLPRDRFTEEFPHLGKAVQRLDEAVKYAKTNLALESDRERFVAQARERLAERIAEGRVTSDRTRSKDVDPPTR
jgi:hypothetical protein